MGSSSASGWTPDPALIESLAKLVLLVVHAIVCGLVTRVIDKTQSSQYLDPNLQPLDRVLETISLPDPPRDRLELIDKYVPSAVAFLMILAEPLELSREHLDHAIPDLEHELVREERVRNAVTGKRLVDEHEQSNRLIDWQDDLLVLAVNVWIRVTHLHVHCAYVPVDITVDTMQSHMPVLKAARVVDRLSVTADTSPAKAEPPAEPKLDLDSAEHPLPHFIATACHYDAAPVLVPRILMNPEPRDVATDVAREVGADPVATCASDEVERDANQKRSTAEHAD